MALVACSASAGSADATSDLTSTSTLCTTLDYGHDRSPSDFYRFFSDDQAAAAYVSALAAQGQLASLSGPGAELQTIARDGHYDRLVAEVFAGFKKAFPRETAGLDAAPPVAIVKSPILNAFALGVGFAEAASAPRDRSPWLFIVHSALVERSLSDAELRGLFAHELGHLILRTSVPEVQRRVRAIYSFPGTEDGVLGAIQSNDARLAAHVEAILERQRRIGGVSSLGLPMVSPGVYTQQLVAMLKAASPTEVCSAARTHGRELGARQLALLPGQSAGLLVPTVPSETERSELDRLSDLVASEIDACLSPLGVPGSFADLAAALQLPVLPIEAELDAIRPPLPLATKLVRAERSVRAELVALRADPAFPVDRIRIYDYEEDADDASVRVLSALGMDPTSLGDFLLDALPANVAASCRADVAAGRPISYGQFIDAHPATCWRYDHVRSFAKALETCAAAPRRTR